MRWQPDPTFYPSAKMAMEAPAEKVVELRFFGGLSVEETAEVLRILPQSVMCRAWLNGSWTDPANPPLIRISYRRSSEGLLSTRRPVEKPACRMQSLGCNPAPQCGISRNQTPAMAGGDRRNRLSHQEIVAAREEIKI